MDFFKREWRQLRAVATVPLMLLSLIFLPLLVVVAVVNFLYLPPGLAWLSTAILILIGMAALLIMSHVAKLYQETAIERYELRGIVSGLEDALVAYDKNFRIFYFNKEAENLFGIKAEDILNYKIQSTDSENPKLKILTQVIYPTLAPIMVSRSPAGSYPQIVDIKFSDPGKELRVSTSPIGDAKGQLMGFVKIINDRTRELAVIRSKNEFITVASHQLRGPLTNINWALELLAQDQTVSAESKNLVDNAVAASRSLLKIIDDLLNIAKIEEGRFGYQYEKVDISEFVNRILAEVLPQAKQWDIKVYFDRPKEGLPSVFIDEQKLSIAFTNLLENAIRYNTKSGEVVVKTEMLPGGEPFIKLSVRDTGIGVPANDIQKLFGKFFRADNALKLQTEGSGLGLYIAKNIIRSHGGEIGADSQLGRGSTFWFTLPTDEKLVPQHEVAIE